MNHETLKECVAFIQRAENLKNTLRSAHTSQGRPESAAEHSWRLCLLVLVFAKQFKDVDPERLLRLAVIHDLGEAVCGDVPAVVRAEQGAKAEAERRAWIELCRGLPEDLSSEFLDLWEEYENAASPEARIVKGLDKLETIIQHNQGANPPDFDYRFNLNYGRECTRTHPLLAQIRGLLDETTRKRAEEADGRRNEKAPLNG